MPSRSENISTQQPNHGEGQTKEFDSRKYEEENKVEKIREKWAEPQMKELRDKYTMKYGYLDSWALECLEELEKNKDETESAESFVHVSNEQLTETAGTSKRKKNQKSKNEVTKAEEAEGYQGDKPLDEILKYIGINDKSDHEQTSTEKNKKSGSKKNKPTKDATQ
ncbi:Hypothetical predicted protein [Cloeon dipterum]|uniref:Uncharacterized protein n=2 Tax=Cloeon dipterum TaxID=197152 RepID=A0A8S1CUF2_9INSE|nr:Hypothetical predicted protein [Cloeon dipterum]